MIIHDDPWWSSMSPNPPMSPLAAPRIAPPSSTPFGISQFCNLFFNFVFIFKINSTVYFHCWAFFFSKLGALSSPCTRFSSSATSESYLSHPVRKSPRKHGRIKMNQMSCTHHAQHDAGPPNWNFQVAFRFLAPKYTKQYASLRRLRWPFTTRTTYPKVIQSLVANWYAWYKSLYPTTWFYLSRNFTDLYSVEPCQRLSHPFRSSSAVMRRRSRAWQISFRTTSRSATNDVIQWYHMSIWYI